MIYEIPPIYQIIEKELRLIYERTKNLSINPDKLLKQQFACISNIFTAFQLHLLNMTNQLPKNEVKPAEADPHKKHVKQDSQTAETIFKYLNIVLLLVMLYCIKGFIAFRWNCEEKGIYTFSTYSLIWCLVGFFGIFIIRYSYYHLMRARIDSIVKPSYQGDERVYKVNSVLKLSFDSMYYAVTSFFFYALFREEYWFPTNVGGCGECVQIYRDYPDWPPAKRSQMEIYFMVQLGVHAFSIFQILVIKRKTQHKFYQFLLHHFVASTLMIFSIMCNEITIGIMILGVHDTSDILFAFGRGYIETIYENKKLAPVIYVVMLGIWTYLRVIIFPFCLISSTYTNIPIIGDEWYMIKFEYLYLLGLTIVLFGLQLFWTFILFKIGFEALRGQLYNSYEKRKVKE